MRKLKITSLILVVVMLVGMLPMGIFSFSASAAVTAPTSVPTDGSVNTTLDIGKTINLLSTSTTIPKKETGVGDKIAYRWRGADGFLVKMKTTAETKFYFDAQLPNGAFGYASYLRVGMAQSASGFGLSKTGSLESDVYIYDGTNWTKQTTNNWGDSYIDLPANFEGYVYSPLDQWYWEGNGGEQNTNNGTTPYVGRSALEFLAHYENPYINQLGFWSENCTTFSIESADIVYADKDLAPTEDDISTTYPWVGAPSEKTVNTNRTGYKSGDWVEYSITGGSGKPSDGAFVSAADLHFDLSDAKGLSVHVDTTGLAAGQQLQFRPYLQYDGGFSDTLYREDMIIAVTANEDTKNTPFYRDFKDATTTIPKSNSANEVPNNNESYIQLVTRTPGSVVYLREDGSNEWTALYNFCTGLGRDSWGGFNLPKNFKGEIYIPMESYWLSSANNGGHVLIPFEMSLVKDIRAFGMFNSLINTAAEGEVNKVVYSDYTVWYDAGYNTVEIGTEEELLNFFNNLNNYDGKKVVLTNDIILNAGWDAASGTAPATKLANRTEANTYFAGTFDGQGHVISGLYLESGLNALGLFGNVKHRTQATVKNVTIVNSLINQTNTGGAIGVTEVGLSAAAGSIFGQVMGEIDVKGQWIEDPNYVNQTHAYIDNVYADVDIKTAAKGGNGMTGYGGIIGLLQSDATIQQTTYAGNLKSYYRGAAGFVGSIYPYQPVVDHDHDGATNVYYPTEENPLNTTWWDRSGNGKNDDADKVGYKNNDTTKLEVGTINRAVNANEVNLAIYDSIFTGSVWNAQQGFTGGVIGYNNINQCNVILGDIIITGSIKNIKDDGSACAAGSTGFIQGGSWASAHGDRVKGHGPEYANYRMFNVTVYDVAGDTAVQAFGQTNGALRIWYDKINIDWNADGKYTIGECKYRNALAEINRGVTIATAADLPAVLLVHDRARVARNELVLEESLTYKVKLPVSALVLAPGKTINDVVKVQFNGTNNKEGVVLTLSEDKAYWEAEMTVLPQDIANNNLRLAVSLTKYDPTRTVNALTNHDLADSASLTTAATTPYQYLQTIVADDTADADLVALAADALRYVAATQEYFGDLYTGTKVNTTDLPEGAGYTADDLADASYLPEVEGNTFTYIALQLEGKLAVRIGVTGGTYTATVNGNAAEVVAGEDYILVYFDVADGMYELNVTDATGDNTLFYEYLSDYICVALTMDNLGATENLLVSLYNYIYSADVYANS